jgi:UrcA family protein
MNRSMGIRSIVLGSTIVLSAAMGIAHAASSVDFASMNVSYRDLNLSRDADVIKLYTRLQRASAKVCRPVPSGDPDFDAYQNCADAALDRAVRLVNSPALQMLHTAMKSQHPWG